MEKVEVILIRDFSHVHFIFTDSLNMQNVKLRDLVNTINFCDTVAHFSIAMDLHTKFTYKVKLEMNVLYCLEYIICNYLAKITFGVIEMNGIESIDDRYR